MKMLISALVLVTSTIVAGQRPSFAGTRPIGFPDTPNRTTTTPDPLGNRFGEPDKLPIEANGDRDLVDRLSKLPIDKQPFWFINWQAYESQRKDPQTYPQRPNAFVDPIPISGNTPVPLNANSGPVNNGFQTPNPGFGGTETTGVLNRFGTTTAPNSNFNNNANFNTGGTVYPNSNVYPDSNAYPNSNLFPNSNGNSNSNVYPNSNVNSNLNVYPNSNTNSNLNVYPTGNTFTNVYPSGSSNSNIYSNGGPISNVNPAGNSASNVYPNGNVNLNSNVYPNSNTNSNVYPTGNSNSNVYQTYNPNLNLKPVVTKNSTFFHTTHNYSWNTTYKVTSGPTKLTKYPEYYPRTDTYPQSSGHEFH